MSQDPSSYHQSPEQRHELNRKSSFCSSLFDVWGRRQGGYLAELCINLFAIECEAVTRRVHYYGSNAVVLMCGKRASNKDCLWSNARNVDLTLNASFESIKIMAVGVTKPAHRHVDFIQPCHLPIDIFRALVDYFLINFTVMSSTTRSSLH